MNWLDWVLLAIIAISAFMGMKVGLIRAALGFVAMIIGWIFAGQISDKVGGIFDSSLSNDTIVTVTTYAVLMIIAIIISGFITKIIKPIMAIFTLGLSSMVDKLGGLALGLLFGFAIVGVVIIAGARLTYDFDTSVLGDKLPGQVSDQLPKIDDVSEKLETALSESTIVETTVNVLDVLPAGALGLAPSDFGTAIEILDFVIEHR
ncbi:MAG: CvpA family protein [SAR202 cluster bacterium]|nr:CvpA family protein [SAR202 cluster bacterium]